MSHTLVQDVESRISDAEAAVRTLQEGYVCDLDSNIEEINEALSGIESELVYVNDELEDKTDSLDEIEMRFGSVDPDDWDTIDADEAEALKADFERVTKALTQRLTQSETELRNLKGFHDAQKLIITALLARFRNLRDHAGRVSELITEDALIELMQDATKDHDSE